MPPPALTTLPALNVRRNTAPQATSICLATGGVFLAAGCYLGAATQGVRTWSLVLLFISVVLFAIAGTLEFRHRAAATDDKVADGPIAKDQIAATQSVTPLPPSPAALDPVRAQSAVTALSVVVPTAGAALPSQAAPALVPAPAAAPHQAETPFDVAALTKLPLSDLLLAALCKDPQGARRIFAQALLQADSGDTPAPVPLSNDVPSKRGS